MLNKLFNSNARVKILSLLFSNENKEFYIQQITKLAETDPSNAHRELIRLEKNGVLLSQRKANQKYYKLNKGYEFFEPLKILFEKYNKKHGPDAWIILEEMPNYYPMMTATAWNVKGANEAFGILKLRNKFSKLLEKFEDNKTALMCPRKEFNKIAGEIIESALNNPEYMEKYFKILENRLSDLLKVVEKLKKTNFKSLSDEELILLHNQAYATYEELHGLHWIQTCLDFGDNLFSKHLMEYLKEKIKDNEDSVGDVFSVLTTPIEESNASLEYRNLLRIMSLIEQKPKMKKYFAKTDTTIILKNLDRIDRKIDRVLNEHVEKFGYLGYNVSGPNWGKDYFVDIIGSLIRQKTKSMNLLKENNDNRNKLVKKQKNLVQKYEISKKYQKLFEISKKIVYTKGTRKDSMFYFYSEIEKLYKEIGSRMFFSIRQVRYLYPHEFSEILLKNKINSERLNKRINFSIHYSTGHYSKDMILEDDEARKFFSNINAIEEDISGINILQGDCASPGRVRGEVTIVNVVEDLEKMKKGNCLVSIATTPDLVPAIKKASSIVTDIGGITCHASIISRELGIPCVIGTKIATKVLRNGSVVDVDATHGKVTIIKR